MTIHLLVANVDGPTENLRALADGARGTGITFLCLGTEPVNAEAGTGNNSDSPNAASSKNGENEIPSEFSLIDVDYYDADRQRGFGLEYAASSVDSEQTQKNIAYLLAMQNQASMIIETDDKHSPLPAFWLDSPLVVNGRRVKQPGWTNAYQYFSRKTLWPRGFPLEQLDAKAASVENATDNETVSPIQQYLSDGNPDLDAVYRFLGPLPITFQQQPPLVLDNNVWCPFNCLNTVWHTQAFALMYLPTTCRFAVADVWRSYVAQACLWPNDWHVSYHAATANRAITKNDLPVFASQVDGFLNAEQVRQTLEGLTLKTGEDHIVSNIELCYDALINVGVLQSEEIKTLDAWLRDLRNLNIVSAP